MRIAAAVTIVLAFGATAPFACRAAKARGEHEMAKRTLAGLCDAYTEAAKKNSDPEVAYKDVQDHFFTVWPPLRKMRAGVEGIDRSCRYPFWLRFARHDYHVANWSCPALDHLLLQMIERQPKLDNPPPSKYEQAIVRVALSGEVSIDGKVVPLESLKEIVRKMHDQDPPFLFSLYREGWATKMHPNADAALSDLTEVSFVLAVCSQPDCPAHEPR